METKYLADRRSECENPDGSYNYEIARKISAEFNEAHSYLWDEWRENYASLESGGERIVEGEGMVKALGFYWQFMDCSSYCYKILRRDAEDLLKDQWKEREGFGIVADMQARGFYPVKEPEDFDLVIYGDIGENDGQPYFGAGHYGMCKDGLVVIKDIMSIHVYKHPVEESAAYSSHVMYFRHATHPDPRDFPLPESYGDVYFADVDGIATPRVDGHGGLSSNLKRGVITFATAAVAIALLSKTIRAFLKSGQSTQENHE